MHRATGLLQHEPEADSFAASCLIPTDKYREFTDAGTNSEHVVTEFAEDVGVAPGIVVGRLQHDGHLPHSLLNGLKKSLSGAEQVSERGKILGEERFMIWESTQ